MIYLIGLFFIFALGLLTVRLFKTEKINPWLRASWGLSLGLGIGGHAAFYTHLLFGLYAHCAPLVLICLCFALLLLLNKKYAPKFKQITPTLNLPDAIGLGLLLLLSVPIIMEANYYPLGGWDAWSCWNLKAKFIFLGQENWKDMLDPAFWRSNTQYPLLLPLINVLGFDIIGHVDNFVPITHAVLFTLLSAAILFWTLVTLTGRHWLSAILTALPFSLEFLITLSISQYSDVLLGLYLLCTVSCLLIAENKKIPQLRLLAALFAGLLSFTKTEGTVLAGLLLAIYCGGEYLKHHDIKKLLPWGLFFTAAALPTIIFTLFMAPKNEAFINGFLSTEKPSDISRLQVVLAFPFLEFISAKWNGLWIFALGSIAVAGKNAWHEKLRWVPLLLGAYLLIVLAYYDINTFFPIAWWLENTLSRILFAIIPTLFLWIGLIMTCV